MYIIDPQLSYMPGIRFTRIVHWKIKYLVKNGLNKLRKELTSIGKLILTNSKNSVLSNGVHHTFAHLMHPQTFCTNGSWHQLFNSQTSYKRTIFLFDKMKLVYLENITNSIKDLVGRAQLCMTDHVSPSTQTLKMYKKMKLYL